jgi:hypothetical protein
MTWFVIFWLLFLTWWIIRIDGKQITQGHQIRDIFNKLNHKKNITYNNKGQINKLV